MLSLVAPYLISYSAGLFCLFCFFLFFFVDCHNSNKQKTGVKLFMARGTFERATGLKVVFAALYILPTGFCVLLHFCFVLYECWVLAKQHTKKQKKLERCFIFCIYWHFGSNINIIWSVWRHFVWIWWFGTLFFCVFPFFLFCVAFVLLCVAMCFFVLRKRKI